MIRQNDKDSALLLTLTTRYGAMNVWIELFKQVDDFIRNLAVAKFVQESMLTDSEEFMHAAGASYP